MSEISTPNDGLVALRRELHRRPETAFLEIGTSALIRELLAPTPWEVSTGPEVIDLASVVDHPTSTESDEAAAEALAAGRDPELVAAVRSEGTAVVATLTGDRPGPRVALRFDMDALALDESSDDTHLPAREGFSSRSAGRMHACGHDGHVAVGLTLAKRLADRDFSGSVTLIFQPAEEGTRGAAAMLAAPWTMHADRLFGLHLGNSMPVGRVAGSGVGLLATSKLRAEIAGVPAHAGSAPEQGRNALMAAAHAVLGVQGISRFGDDMTRVNVGTLSAGTAANVIAAHAVLGIEVRAGRAETLNELHRRVAVVVGAAAAMQECESSLVTCGTATSLTPDDDAIDLVLAAAARERVSDVVRTHPLGASDDFSLLARETQAHGGITAFALVGGGNAFPHHHPRFDIDERCLPVALNVLENLVRHA